MPSLSHSQIDTWQKCPMRYKLQYVEPVPEVPQPSLVLGTAVHAAIEQDNLARIAGETALSQEAMTVLAHATLQQAAGETLAAQVPDLAARASAMLAVYVRQVQPLFTPLASEQSFYFPIPGQDEWGFAGRIDALVQDQHGQTLLVDYKTSRVAWLKGEEHGLQQATAYLWAMQQQERPVTAILFIPLITSQIAGMYAARMELRKTLRTAEEIAAYQDLIASIIPEMQEAAATGCYTAKPGKQCQWCSVAQACPMRAA